MRLLLFTLLFLSAGAQAQIKKDEHGRVNKVQKKTGFKKTKKTHTKNYGLRNFRDDEVKRIINLSQQNDTTPKKEIVRKNSSGGYEYFDYEETRSSRTRLYLFV
ncbi:hypothetical protein [Chryseobacterium arthrosphaerae]|uniref:hypothetical protein n=1 Tax=Chryseobacterium arthrosphaerae TaxID=651561 RepID=UPI00241C3125|nr:hypothetical protein [Chryseobacterium arthrosphaerae]